MNANLQSRREQFRRSRRSQFRADVKSAPAYRPITPVKAPADLIPIPAWLYWLTVGTCSLTLTGVAYALAKWLLPVIWSWK